MPFELSPLPYSQTALEPAISARTMELHHGKHHAGYVDKLNELVEGTPYASMTLEQVIEKAAGDRKAVSIFNNAAQAWNHDFFWRSMTPGGGGTPGETLGRPIAASFGTFAELSKQFVSRATEHFGSGWVWLVAEGHALRIVSTANADTPLASGQHALLTCDLWEHAYYLDYQNEREEFVRAFLEKLASWEFAAEQFARMERTSTITLRKSSAGAR